MDGCSLKNVPPFFFLLWVEGVQVEPCRRCFPAVCLCEPCVFMHTLLHVCTWTLDSTNLYHSSSQGPVKSWSARGHEEIEASVEVSVRNVFFTGTCFLYGVDQCLLHFRKCTILKKPYARTGHLSYLNSNQIKINVANCSCC